jgi:hypothetical protein
MTEPDNPRRGIPPDKEVMKRDVPQKGYREKTSGTNNKNSTRASV